MADGARHLESKEAKPDAGAMIDLEHGSFGDLKVIMRIMGSAFSPLYGESWNEHQCRSMLALPGTQLLIASNADRPCGFTISREVAGEEELLMIAVDPQYQNTGIGLAMMRRLVEDAMKNGVTAIFLEVRSNNPAQGLYKRLGFQKIGLRPAYYTGDTEEKFDAITYKKSL
ncbi:ribosomal protein S18-alanine N-acetyltransferase [Sphingorhabdus sp. Alg231-15]|uniref:ribosomal protein S18-alanine N-acetyltransferase n=1 Tax=Sphingorhabdus sp. Alg231-15 TaxID=1922222 RepID=UPI00307B5000